MDTAAITIADVQLLRRGLAIGNRAVVLTIRCEGYPVQLGDGLEWFDTRPMLDPRECAAQMVDENAEMLSYAEQAGLVRRDAEQRHLVCIVWSGA